MKPDHAAEFSALRRFAFSACWMTRLTPAETARSMGKASLSIAYPWKNTASFIHGSSYRLFLAHDEQAPNCQVDRKRAASRPPLLSWESRGNPGTAVIAPSPKPPP